MELNKLYEPAKVKGPLIYRITLYFENTKRLWDFINDIRGTSVEINPGKLSLICEGSETAIALIREKYDARPKG